MQEFGKVAIIGAGLMGHGLALVHAAGGLQVTLQDVDPARIDTARQLIRAAMQTMVEAGALDAGSTDGIMARIGAAPDLKTAVTDADLVIEAVVENTDVKRAVFAEIAEHAPEYAVVASNTSHLDVFPLIPPALQRRCLIAHWYTPPYIIDLVDLAAGPETAPEIMATMEGLYTRLGKKPVVFEKFVTGYVANRLQSAITLEITRLLDEGWATPEAIDTSIKYGLSLRMALMGALMKADFTGLDMMRRAMGNMTYQPPVPTGKSATLEKLIAEGKQGVMSGSGFFDYGGMTPAELFRNRDTGLLRLKAEVERIEKEAPLQKP